MHLGHWLIADKVKQPRFGVSDAGTGFQYPAYTPKAKDADPILSQQHLLLALGRGKISLEGMPKVRGDLLQGLGPGFIGKYSVAVVDDGNHGFASAALAGNGHVLLFSIQGVLHEFGDGFSRITLAQRD